MGALASICSAVGFWLHNHNKRKEDDNRHRVSVPFIVPVAASRAHRRNPDMGSCLASPQPAGEPIRENHIMG